MSAKTTSNELSVPVHEVAPICKKIIRPTDDLEFQQASSSHYHIYMIIVFSEIFFNRPLTEEAELTASADLE